MLINSKPYTNFSDSFATISRFRIVVGLIIGSSYTLILYAFQFVLREFLRVASTSEFNDMWLLSTEEVTFYNWFAAALAILIGQSACIAYWFSRPKRFRERGIRVRSAILNSQGFLSMNFSMWFLKLSFLFALFFGITWPNSYPSAAMSFYPTFAIVPILVILLLFFQSWNVIRLKFKLKSYKWMLISFFSLGIVSWAISMINVVDYESVNERILAENVWYTHDLQLPEVSYCEYAEVMDRDAGTYIFFISNENEHTILLKTGDRWQPVYQEGEYNHDFGNVWCNPNKGFGHATLYIDKRIKMKVIEQIWADFRNNDVVYFSYAVLPINAELPPAAYHGTSVNTYLPYQYKNQDDYVKHQELLDTIPNQIRVIHTKAGSCNVNGVDIAYNQLADELFELFIVETDFVVNYVYSDELSFGDYLQFKNEINWAIWHVRDFFSWDEDGKPYDIFERGRYNEFEELYPLRMTEVSASLFLSH